jgi:hypothetical protein
MWADRARTSPAPFRICWSGDVNVMLQLMMAQQQQMMQQLAA